MTIQSQDVFRRCVDIAKTFEAEDRIEDGVAILRALQVYLDAIPAFNDRSCFKMVEGLLSKMSARMREKQTKEKR